MSGIGGLRLHAVLLQAALLCALAACQSLHGEQKLGADPSGQVVTELSLVMVHAVELPTHGPDRHGAARRIRELSGIAYLGALQTLKPASDDPVHRFLAVSDKDGHVAVVDVTFGADGRMVQVSVPAVIVLEDAWDFEAIAIEPQVGLDHTWLTLPQTIWLAEETHPGVHRYRLPDGQRDTTLQLPAIFRPQGRRLAIRPNRGFESLAISTDGRWMVFANEEALRGDGPAPDMQQGTRVRLVLCERDGQTWQPRRQFVHATQPLGPLAGSPMLSGLVEMTFLPDGRLLLLERAATRGLPPFVNRVFLVDLEHAEALAMPEEALGQQPFTPLETVLLWKSPPLASPGNLEGLTLGPQMADGRWLVLGVVDDGDPLSRHVVISFLLDGLSSPPRADEEIQCVK